MNRLIRHTAAAAVLVTAGLAAGLWLSQSSQTPRQVKQTIITTIQQEADTTVLITGYLQLSAAVEVTHTRYYPDNRDLPWYARPMFQAIGSPQVNLGTTRTKIHVPGRVSYGLDTRHLGADDIHLREDGLVRIQLPELDVYASEPYLKELQIDTELGWARWSKSGEQLERQALGRLRRALHHQGKEHLQHSNQPRIHTIRALEQLLTPVLQSAGFDNPRLEFTPSPLAPPRG